jgi:hypothetical protein
VRRLHVALLLANRIATLSPKTFMLSAVPCFAILHRGFPIVTVSLGPQDTGSSRREVKLEQVPYHAPRTYMVGLPFEPEMYCNDWYALAGGLVECTGRGFG